MHAAQRRDHNAINLIHRPENWTECGGDGGRADRPCGGLQERRHLLERVLRISLFRITRFAFDH